MRLVLDTNVWLDLLLFEDPRCAPLRQALEAAEVHILLREDCHAEWLRVLAYPALRVEPVRQSQLALQQRALCQWVTGAHAEAGTALPRCRDRDDQKFIELAWEGAADCLLSRDQALLDLDRRCRRQGLFAIARPEDWPPAEDMTACAPMNRRIPEARVLAMPGTRPRAVAAVARALDPRLRGDDDSSFLQKHCSRDSELGNTAETESERPVLLQESELRGGSERSNAGPTRSRR